MAGYHETFPIQADHATEDLRSAFCAFHGKKFTKTTSGWDLHKGKLIEKFGDRHRKVFVKVRRGLLEKECAAEVKALRLIGEVIEKVHDRHVKVVPTFYAEIQTLSKIDKWTTSKRHMNVVKGDFVLIQDRLQREEEKEVELWALDKKPRRGRGKTETMSSLAKLALEIHRLSDEEYAISSVKGFAVEESVQNFKNSSNRVTYYLTSVTVQSKRATFGPKDRGMEGVKAFQKWAKLQENEPPSIINSTISRVSPCVTHRDRLQPTAPPAEEETSRPHDSQIQQLNDRNHRILLRHVHDTWSEEIQDYASDLTIWRQMSHGLSGPWGNPPTYAEAVLAAGLMDTNFWGAPPPYSTEKL
ncbi:hypothetical protein BaRGS_00014934 [Batillaria attramentaria]|uniref:Uncharacterized protein n=1 Tax=Batillaria attramentaria TaxID=370345 RepID=A0ABD0L2M6_9CAEN|nr:hypothetical protein BaRGS_003806 [Batillaria attramentaria]